jgi:hypothetical protein
MKARFTSWSRRRGPPCRAWPGLAWPLRPQDPGASVGLRRGRTVAAVGECWRDPSLRHGAPPLPHVFESKADE